MITGYVDVGFAKAQGNGTSFPASYATAPPRGPADYYVDTFAPAVNSRGEAASVAAPPGTTIAGFLPRSAGIGGKPSFLINTADVDLRYTAPELPDHDLHPAAGFAAALQSEPADPDDDAADARHQ